MEGASKQQMFPPYAMPSVLWIESAGMCEGVATEAEAKRRPKKMDWVSLNSKLEGSEHIRKCDLKGEQGVYQTGFNIFTRQFQPLI